MVSEIKHPKFGIRDIAFDVDENSFIWLANNAGQLNSFFQKLNFFGPQETKAKDAPGIVEFHSDVNSDISKPKFNYIHPKPAICIDWCHKSNLVAVGFESGEIGIFDYDPQKRQLLKRVIAKVHNKRVLLLKIIGDLIYSISKGKKLRIFSIASQTVVSGIV